MKHVVIAGTGRSGSNRLLDILDVHETTNCRNELQRFDTPLGALMRSDAADVDKGFADRWNKAVRDAATRKSKADRKTLKGKSYSTGLAPIATRLMYYDKLRNVFIGRSDEWEIPRFALRKDAEILPVFKVLTVLAATVRVHSLLPDQTLLHVVRDPRAYLQSWWNRLVVARQGHESTYAGVRNQVADILAENDQPPMSADYSLSELLRGELWLLRHRHDLIHSETSKSDRYELFPYEQTSKDPVGDAKRAFDLAGLTFTDQHQTRIEAQKNTLFSKGHTEKLSAELVEQQIETVLKGSPVFERYLK